MSAFKKPNFAKELAYRTKHNYYKLFEDKKNNSKKHLFEENLQQMENEGFSLDEYFDITQLINSLIGLLVFPQQEYFAANKGDEDFKRLPKLSECLNRSGYINTYKEVDDLNNCSVDEASKPSNILRHMKNAISHKRIMIEPESSDGMKITDICFKDECVFVEVIDEGKVKLNSKSDATGRTSKIKSLRKEYGEKNVYNCEFNLCISTDVLEEVLMEIADYLISFDENKVTK